MNGKVRGILLFLLTLIILGAIGFALYTLRGLDGLPLIGGKTEKPVVVETPEPTEEPEITPEPEEIPVEPEETPEAAPVEEQPVEDAIFYQKGSLRTESGTLGFKYEVLAAQPSGEETDSVSLGHVYDNRGKIRVQFLNADGSLHQDPIELSYSTENLKQDISILDLNNDKNEELLIQLRTNENEQAVLLFGLNTNSGDYDWLKLAGREELVWGSGFDAASGLLWYRHGTNPIQYDCFELQGSELVLTCRLEDSPRGSAKERFTEYTVDGSRMLIVLEKVPASEIDHTKWSFVNFN